MVPNDAFCPVTRATQQERADLLGQRPVTLWLTGLSAAGKSTIAFELEKRLIRSRHPCFVLDGDIVRHGLSRNLDFTLEGRRENVRRVAEVAKLFNEAGLIAIAALISPLREDREMARRIITAERFVEIYLSANLEVCERRDPKGLYARARAGQIVDFTGISAPYEPPHAPALVVDTAGLGIDECVGKILQEALVLPRV